MTWEEEMASLTAQCQQLQLQLDDERKIRVAYAHTARDLVTARTAERDEARRLLRDAVRCLEIVASHEPPWTDDHVRLGAAAEAIRNACPWWQS